MQKATIKDVNLKEETVLVRVDFNVPMNDKKEITDDTRIREALPTIKYLLKQNAKVILISHLGRPDGKVDKKYSLKPVAKKLSELLESYKVIFAKDTIGEDAKLKVSKLKFGQVLLLENLRFSSDEENNDENFAKELANFAKVFVNDAFGTAHRKHASTYGVANFLPSYAGLLMAKEIEMLGSVINNPTRPFVAVLGGAKIKDKITVIERLIDKVDYLIIGGGMAYTFVSALEGKIGASLIDESKIEFAKNVMVKAYARKVKIVLPVDEVVATQIDENAETKIVKTGKTPDGYMALDIGPKTIKKFSKILKKAKTVLWNGPMGVFEMPKFENGTKEICSLMPKLKATTIVGGGDSVSAINKFTNKKGITHISTGGGASLKMLEGSPMPAIEILKDK